MTKNTIDINEHSIKKFVETLRPDDLEVRKQLDIGYTYDGKIAVLFEVRPSFMDENVIMNLEFAKIRHYKSKQLWQLYWMRANGNWELYQPFPESTNVDDILGAIEKDEHACFFG